ncbi:MAG: hypothetical protein ACD_40C00100G0001 [uncultured bacterium]|nr:MAG: hypothetical protein ACD_40C00100G0001 [uncultured bacterium]
MAKVKTITIKSPRCIIPQVDHSIPPTIVRAIKSDPHILRLTKARVYQITINTNPKNGR